MTTDSKFTIKNKTFIVTGAHGFFGKHICTALANEGNTVFALNRSEKNLLSHENIKEITCDLSDDCSIIKAFHSIKSYTSTVDVLVNNAYYGNNKPFNNTTREDLKFTFDGCVGQTHSMIMNFIEQFDGINLRQIINISSMYGLVAPNHQNYPAGVDINPLSYGVAKAALIQYTKYMAMALANKKILINSISYGPFPNPEKVQNSEFIDLLSKSTMLGRVGDLSEIIAPIIFLSMPKNSFMTGQNIVIDGGWTSW